VPASDRADCDLDRGDIDAAKTGDAVVTGAWTMMGAAAIVGAAETLEEKTGAGRDLVAGAANAAVKEVIAGIVTGDAMVMAGAAMVVAGAA